MSELQTIATVIMALVIGFVIGRASKKSTEYNPHQLTPKEWASLQPDSDNNPYDDAHADVISSIESGNFIEAIKKFRKHHSASLKEAKDAVDAISKNHH